MVFPILKDFLSSSSQQFNLVERNYTRKCDRNSKWNGIDQASCKGTSLGTLNNGPTKIKTGLYSGNIAVFNTLKMWKPIRTYLKVPNAYLSSSVIKNHGFIPSIHESLFSLETKGHSDYAGVIH